MPFSRRAPFFNINKNQYMLDAIRRNEEYKQRSNSSQKPFEFLDDDDMQSEKLFHTICVANSGDFPLASIPNATWTALDEIIMNMFENGGKLNSGQLREAHELVNSLIKTEIKIFVPERLKSLVIPRAVRTLKTKIHEDGEDYLETLAAVWKEFYHEIVPTLVCMLYNIESIYDRNPPVHDNRIQLEKMAALVVTPYLGYYGLYEDYNQEPVIKSLEPYHVGARRPFGNERSVNRNRNGYRGSLIPEQPQADEIGIRRSRKISLQPR